MKKLVTKSLLIVLIMIAVIINLTVISNAASSLDARISASPSELEVGKEIVVAISLANINVGEGVNTFQGTIGWDTDVLEFIDYEKSVNDWTNTLNTTDGTLVSLHMSGLVKTDTTIAKLTFKVKDVEELEETTITLSDIESANTAEKVNPEDTSVTLKVKEPSTEEPGNTTSGNTTPGNTTPGNTTPGNTTPGNTTPGNTTTNKTPSGNAANKVIPKAGLSNTIVVATIMTLALVGIVSYVQYKKYKEI